MDGAEALIKQVYTEYERITDDLRRAFPPKKESAVRYEVEDIGVEHPQYFQGRGTAFTKWDAVFVGVGSDPHEAFEDACESAAQSDYDTTSVVEPEWGVRNKLHADCEHGDDADDCEMLYHVALWIEEGGA